LGGCTYILSKRMLFGFLITTWDGYIPLKVYILIFTEIPLLDGYII
jgi:hypothetical protein